MRRWLLALLQVGGIMGFAGCGGGPGLNQPESARRGPKYTVRYELPGGQVRTLNIDDVSWGHGFAWFTDPETGKSTAIGGTRTEVVTNW